VCPDEGICLQKVISRFSFGHTLMRRLVLSCVEEKIKGQELGGVSGEGGPEWSGEAAKPQIQRTSIVFLKLFGYGRCQCFHRGRGHCSASSLCDLVFAIFNRQDCCPENTHLGFAPVGLW